MAAPEGNQFWKLRSKHGRDKIFESPEMLYEACCEYFEMMDGRTIDEQDWVGKDGDEVMRHHKPPYTLSGLFVFLDIDRSTWDNYGKDEKYKEFFPVVTRVNNIIFTQKFEGAATGFYNANIVAMELGLKAKTENDHNHSGLPPLTLVPPPTK